MSTFSESSSYIAHVVHDEKFIDMGYTEFEAVAPGQNRLLMREKPHPLQFVKNNAVNFCSLSQIKKLFHDDQCAAIIFHSLPDFSLLKHVPTNKLVVWIGWGYDYYSNLLSGLYPDGLMLPKTRELLNKKPVVRKSGSSICQSIAKLILGTSARYYPKLLAKVDIFSPVIELEYQMACELNPWFKAKYIPWDYGIGADDFSVGGLSTDHPGPNILIGNSAAYENNHVEIFDLLACHVDLSGRKIIVPLSYGGDDWYREKIISLGRKQFGDQFIALTDFMPVDEYIALLRSCGFIFMNHLRQQGGGNICITMLNGGKIYMNPRNPLYHWLEAEGGAIESIDAIGSQISGTKKSLAPLSKLNKKKNIDLVNKHWGRETQRRNTQRLVDVLMNRALKEPE